MKKRILIDLDIITVALWDKGKYANISRKFISKVEEGIFYVITPILLLQLVNKWSYEKLRRKIKEFYLLNTDEFIERLQIIEEIISKDINFERLFNELINKSIKEEDVTLILVASLREAEILTFNKIHLKDKEDKINEILSKYGLRNIKITSPE